MCLVEKLSRFGKRTHIFQESTTVFALYVTHLFQNFKVLTYRYVGYIEDAAQILHFGVSVFPNKIQNLYSALIEGHMVMFYWLYDIQ